MSARMSIRVGGITPFTTVYNDIVITNNVINGAEINVLGPTDYDPLMADIIVANNIVRDRKQRHKDKPYKRRANKRRK